MLQEWVTDIRDQCLGAKVPFFFKQWGSAHLCLQHFRR
jgi:protein gp37